MWTSDHCHECNGLGFVRCVCGGDLCVCGQEEVPCRCCYPGHYVQDEDDLEEEAANLERGVR